MLPLVPVGVGEVREGVAHADDGVEAVRGGGGDGDRLGEAQPVALLNHCSENSYNQFIHFIVCILVYLTPFVERLLLPPVPPGLVGGLEHLVGGVGGCHLEALAQQQDRIHPAIIFVKIYEKLQFSRIRHHILPSSTRHVQDRLAVLALEQVDQEGLVLVRSRCGLPDVELPDLGSLAVRILVGQTCDKIE